MMARDARLLSGVVMVCAGVGWHGMSQRLTHIPKEIIYTVKCVIVTCHHRIRADDKYDISPKKQPHRVMQERKAHRRRNFRLANHPRRDSLQCH